MTKEESLAYGRGYAVGRKRLKRDISVEAASRKANALWNRAFLALLPHALEHGEQWKIGGENCKSTDMRMKLAGLWADRAVNHHLKGQ